MTRWPNKPWKTAHLFTVALAVMLAFGLGLTLLSTAVLAAETRWLVGEPLRQALAQPTGITWSNIPLRRALQSLSQTQKLAVVLDRRIDPDQKIELSFDEVPLSEALQRIASRLRIGATMLGPVAYIGPQTVTLRLRTVAAIQKADIGRFPPAVRTRWTQLKAWNWDELATPRDLLASLARENGLEIDGVNQIPHDLWAAADLPPLSLPEKLLLILAQFDLTYEVAADGTSIRLAPLPDQPKIDRTYSVSGSPQEAVARLREVKMLADSQISVAGNRVSVRGRQEDHETVSELLANRTARRTSITEGRKVYTLRVEQPVGKLLAALGPRLDLDIRVDQAAIAAARLSMDRSVQLDVKDVTADELLRAVLDPVGLTFQRNGSVVDVKPKTLQK